MCKLKVNPAGKEETIDFYLDENKHPIAFKAKLDELICSGLSEDEAREFINGTPFCLEVYYSPYNGLFMVESEPLDCITPYDPYTGEEMENPEV